MNKRKYGMLLLPLMLLGCKNEAPAPEPVRPVRTVVVGGQAGQAAVRYAGEIRPRYEARLGFRVAGKLALRKVDVGQTVQAGQVLAELDPRDLKLALAADEAQFKSAQVEWERAQADLERYRQLLAQHFISSAEFERQKSLAAGAQARFSQAQAQWRMGSNQSDYAWLKADRSGVVTGVEAEVGQVVAAGQPVIRLADPKELEVLIHVPESRVAQLRAAPHLRVNLWAKPGVALQGQLRELAPEADPVTRTYAAKISLAQPGPEVRMGMTAEVALEMPQQPGLRLPLSALYQTSGAAQVWRVNSANSTVQAVPVQVGRFDGNDVLVTAGVQAGDRVVTAGVTKLHPGQVVRLLPELDASAEVRP